MKRVSICLVAGIILSAVFCSCVKNNEGGPEQSGIRNDGFGARGVSSLKMSKTVSAVNADNAAPMAFQAGAAETEEASESGNLERKLIKNGNISIEVNVLSEAESAVEAWCKSYGGFISTSDFNERSAWFSVRIPAVKFDEAMEAVGKLGVVKSKGSSVQDVSEQFYDLQGRLENRRLLRSKLKSYMEKTSNIADLLKIETELNNVQSEIESMEGRFKRLSGQIEYSTISVNVMLPYNTTERGFEFPDFGEGVRIFGANVIKFLVSLVTWIFYSIVCGIPVVAVLSLLFWLLFGRVGLLIKLYKKLKR